MHLLRKTERDDCAFLKILLSLNVINNIQTFYRSQFFGYVLCFRFFLQIYAGKYCFAFFFLINLLTDVPSSPHNN